MSKHNLTLGVTAIAGVVSVGGLALAGLLFAPACTKSQAVSIANATVQVGVDICDVAPQLIPPTSPPGSVVALLCPLVEGGSKTVEVLIDTAIWNAMVKANEEKKRVDKIH